jgi:hypothetical protein
MMATNGFIDPVEESIMVTGAMIRRIVVLPMSMRVSAMCAAPPELEASFIDFLCLCVHSRISHANAVRPCTQKC